MIDSRKTVLFIAMVTVVLPISAGFDLPELTVDCDSGANLQSAVNKVAGQGGGIVRFTGTCGRVSVSTPYIEVIGESPAASRIDGGSGTAISAFGPGHLVVRNAFLMGSQTVTARGTERVVFLHDCEIKADLIGLHVNQNAGVLVADSVIYGGQYGIRARDSEVVVERSVLRETGFGARVFESKLALIDVEVTSTEIVGVQILDRSTVTIERGSFSENNISHLSVRDGSHLESLDTRVGGAEDTTHLALDVGGRAYVGLYASDPAAEIWGSANVHDDSYVAVDGATIQGSMNLRSFSRLMFNGTATGLVDCKTGADAACDFAATATTRGCNSAPEDCQPKAGVPSRESPSLSAPPDLRGRLPKAFSATGGPGE